jgi:hypothetical protein
MKPLILTGFALVIASLSCHNVVQLRTADAVSKSSTPTTKLHLPQPWLDEMESPYFIQQIEVRQAPNSPGDEFFFGALPNGDNFYADEVDKNLPKPRYGKNMFAVNFSADPRARVATQQEWESGSRIPTKPRTISANSPDYASGEIEYRQKHYSKPGKYWDAGMLSPSGKWLAAFSYSGEKRPPDLFFGGGDVPSGDAFLQIYDTVTGRKVFEWEAQAVKHPAHFTSPVVWLEDRYFLFPEDEAAQNFIVVNLPPATPEVNPVTMQFPSRRDAGGRPVPAGARNEVWIPLIPLTKEQAAKLTAPYDTEISEVRVSPSAAELMFSIREETENRRVNRQQRDGAGEYHFKVVNTYYYAVSLDNPTQTRFATKEEWERGQKIRSDRATTASAAETVKGTYPPYRQFPKTGTTWGSPPALSAAEWIAVFSYGPDREMFVDVYDQRLGDKLLATALPYTVAPNGLFKNAMWIEGGYILLPLNASLDSFALWRLPGGL